MNFLKGLTKIASIRRSPAARTRWVSIGLWMVVLIGWSQPAPVCGQDIEALQRRVVKIYGAGGFRGLEAYQSGLFISAEGHVLTTWSYLLAGQRIQVRLHDGQRQAAELVGYDPLMEVALLKIKPVAPVPFFDRPDQDWEPPLGSSVWVLSNAFGIASGDEPVSLQVGRIAGRTSIELANQPVSNRASPREVLLLDAITSNPGSGGGAVVARDSRLVGMLGKERRETSYRIWINYAIPHQQLWESIDRIQSGQVAQADDPADTLPQEPLTLELLGLEMVPHLFPQTPPFIDSLRSDSAAQRGGLQADDLIISVASRLTPNMDSVVAQLRRIDRDQSVAIEVRREDQILKFTLRLNAN